MLLLLELCLQAGGPAGLWIGGLLHVGWEAAKLGGHYFEGGGLAGLLLLVGRCHGVVHGLLWGGG